MKIHQETVLLPSDNKSVPSQPQELREPAGLLPGGTALHQDDGVRVRSKRHSLRASPRY